MYYLTLDVGGTMIKAGVMTEQGELLETKVYSYDAKSKESKKEIFKNFANILDELTSKITEDSFSIGGIGMAFPGPFDYKHGICLMQGLDKYDAIYQCSIKEGILSELTDYSSSEYIDNNTPFIYLHDIEAFAIGESKFGVAIDDNKVMYLCIGTGAGSAFMEQHQIVKQKSNQVPDQGWIYNTLFRESMIDDYLSVRGLSKLSKEIYGEVKDGKSLYILANQGDEKAALVFDKFGEWVEEAITPFLSDFEPDRLVLGGQISKSFSLFAHQLEAQCQKRHIPISITIDTSKKVMEGLYVQLQEEYKHF